MKASFEKFYKYRFLLQNLISRDIKVKYRRSVLGIAWSVLNPLFMMLVMTAVFSFFFQSEIENFPVYLLCGQLMFTFFSESTTNAMGSILVSSALIKKVYVPKYIFPLEKVCFSFINMLFSLVALFLVMVLTGATFHITLPLVIIPMSLLFVFNLGVGMFLSSAAVYFRDIMHFWSILIMALTYMTPIFYPEEMIHGSIIAPIYRLNPLYWFVITFREIVLYGNVPSLIQIGACTIFSIISIIIGLYTFKKSQDNFILYI